MNKYEQQAAEFLQNTNTKLSVEFSHHGKHFADDKSTRDVYTCTLSRGKRSYTFNFGQSIVNSGFYYTIGKQKFTIDRKYLQPEFKKNLIFHIKKESGFTFLNNGESDVIHYPKAPTAYDILACLTKYDPGTFEDFCSEFGCDTDSRNAERTYKAVVKEWEAVNRLFTDEEIEELTEIN